MEVNTATLMFDNAEDEPAFAVINAPRTGKEPLRAAESDQDRAIQQCKAGVIVYVIEEGKTFSLVDYQGTAGYVKNAALAFQPPAGGDTLTGQLHYNGDTDGAVTINVRLTAGGRVIGEFPTGTNVTVLRQGIKWSEIEVNEYHGFVMSKFLAIQE